MELKAQKSKACLTYENVFTPEEYLGYCETYDREPSKEDFQDWIREELLAMIFEQYCYETEVSFEDVEETT